MNAVIKMRMLVSGVLLAGGVVLAADAQTSATAGRRGNTQTAAATANHGGSNGFSRTQTHAGEVTVAQGVAVGVDDDGVAVSLSTAVAPQHGPALATTLNIAIDSDGDVSTSTGLTVADGPFERIANAGGWARSQRGRSTAGSESSGRTDPSGAVRTQTSADSTVVAGREVDRHQGVRQIERVPSLVVSKKPVFEKERPVYRRPLSQEFPSGRLANDFVQRRTLAQDFESRSVKPRSGRKL